MENIEVNFGGPRYKNRLHVLQKYTTTILQFRALAEQTYRVRPYYFDNYIHVQYFQHHSNNAVNGTELTAETSYLPSLTLFKVELLKHILNRRRQIMYWTFYLSLILLCVVAYRHETSADVAERGVRYFAYPGMRMWRRMTLPLIKRFPRLTELHDESCLMENPFFQIEDNSCEHCAHVLNVLDMTGSVEDLNLHNEKENFFEKHTVPFVFKINQSPIHLNDFYDIYAENFEIFQRDAYRVQSTNHDVTNLEELFGQFNQSTTNDEAFVEVEPQQQTHNLWRCNRMLPARLMRKIFTRPKRLPSNGLALERYMAIDTPRAHAYTLPGTECAHVYIQQALGTRFIILRPTSECKHRCRTLSVRLPQSFVLSYNWMYWKPISAPDPVSETLSISLIGSYC